MKKILRLFICFVMVLPLQGCWDSIGLEELLIVYGLGVDISQDHPDKYLFTIGFPTIIEEAPEEKSIYFTEAPSLGAGKCNMQNKVYRQISYDNIRVIVFGEEAAKRGIINHVDSMFREPLFRGTARFAVVKDRAVDLLSIKPPVALLVSSFIYDSIEQNYEGTTVPITTLRNFSHEYYTDGIEPAMPYICYGAKPDELNIGCIALFKKDRMIYKLHGHQSKAFMLLRGEINRGIYAFDYSIPDNNNKESIAINLKGGNSKIKTELIDSKLHIYHDITVNSTLAEFIPFGVVLDKDTIKKLEEYLSQKIHKDVSSTLKILQTQLKNDNVGYGKFVKANHPEFFNAANWNAQFADAVIHINTTVKITTVGVLR
ncbi:Ger(x)C family spore germination protein [Anaerosolibacter sp.]|uniref:Ger(x)C family spore germination protein n=1 Tax=Anaerosolibacter sp. TaxID=1872527 RepID=UPI0039EEEFD7